MSKSITLPVVVAALVVSAGAGPCHAQEEAPVARAQVIAELNAARASGELQAMAGEDSGSFWMSRQLRPSTLTRAQVRAEFLAVCGQGDCAAANGEDSARWLAHLERRGPQYAGPDSGTKHDEPAVRTASQR